MSQQKQPRVIGVGAANVDVHGQSRKAIVMRDSNPSYMATSVGGVTRNILENLARQSVPVALLSAVGDDLYGEKILRDSTAAGIDLSHVRVKPGAISSTYIAILDERGDMLLGMSDMRIIEDLPNAYLDENAGLLRGAEAIVCDACLPLAFLDHLVSEAAGDTPVLIDPAVYYGHREMDTAMSRLFGGFEPAFYAAYQNERPLEQDWEERIDLCNLYPLLVHVNLFGGGYAQQVTAILGRFV